MNRIFENLRRELAWYFFGFTQEEKEEMKAYLPICPLCKTSSCLGRC